MDRNSLVSPAGQSAIESEAFLSCDGGSPMSAEQHLQPHQFGGLNGKPGGSKKNNSMVSNARPSLGGTSFKSAQSRTSKFGGRTETVGSFYTARDDENDQFQDLAVEDQNQGNGESLTAGFESQNGPKMETEVQQRAASIEPVVRDQIYKRQSASITTISEHLDGEDENDYEINVRNSMESQRKMSHAASLRPSLSSVEKKDCRHSIKSIFVPYQRLQKDLEDATQGLLSYKGLEATPASLKSQNTQRIEHNPKEQQLLLGQALPKHRQTERYARVSAMSQQRPSTMLTKRERTQLGSIYQKQVAKEATKQSAWSRFMDKVNGFSHQEAQAQQHLNQRATYASNRSARKRAAKAV